jgi:hypothetical protein
LLGKLISKPLSPPLGKEEDAVKHNFPKKNKNLAKTRFLFI